MEYMDKLGNQVCPMIQTLFLNNDVVFQDDNVHIHTTGTVKPWLNFNIFPSQHKHHIWTLLNHSGQFWRLGWGIDSHLQYL
jgi:hypothetical protein